ncbi:MAG: hypothetical protein ACOVQM_13795, partial [Pirellula sp.]
MASDILHIKDGYFFEVPKALWRSKLDKPSDFPSWFVRLDSDFQAMEAETLIVGLREMGVAEQELVLAKENWLEWQSASSKNAAWPFDAYLEKQSADAMKIAGVWTEKNSPKATNAYQAYLANNTRPSIDWFVQVEKNPTNLAKWNELKAKVNSDDYLQSFLTEGPKWDAAKLAEYNATLDGKIMIPQPFGTPRNAYEPESGFCISRYMIIELVVAVICLALF